LQNSAGSQSTLDCSISAILYKDHVVASEQMQLLKDAIETVLKHRPLD